MSELTSGLHCMKPRFKKERRPRERRIKYVIPGYTIMDAGFDPYCSYLIVSRLGAKVSVRYRRYNQFKALNKCVGKKLGIKTPFAPAPLLGGRNLSAEFIVARKALLEAYLNELCENAEAVNTPAVMAFFGQTPITNLTVHEIETRAIDGTLFNLGLPYLQYEDLGDGLTKIVVFRIKLELWQKILDSCPPSPRARRAAMRVANKFMDSVIAPAVETAVRGAKSACEPVQTKLTDKLVEMSTVVSQARLEVINKLKAAVVSALDPVVSSLSGLVQKLSVKLAPPAIAVLAKPIQTVAETADKLIEYFAANDEDSVNHLCEALVEVVEGIKDKIKESMKDAVAELTGDHDGLITNVVLEGIMGLIELIVDIFAAIVMAIFNPVPWFHTLIFLIHYKEKVGECDPADFDGVMRVCDDQEDDLDFVIEYDSGDFMAGAQIILDAFNQLDGKAGTFFGVLSDMFEDFRDCVHYRFFRRFYKKFGDYIWGSLKYPSDRREWKEKVNHSFALAFRSAIKHCLKGLGNILLTRFCMILEAPIMHKIDKHITPQINSALAPITDAIPEVARDFLDVEGMVHDVIRGSVHDSCMHIIEDQIDVFKQEFATKVGFIWSAPIFPTLAPFPYVYDSTGVVPVVAEAPSAPALDGAGVPMMTTTTTTTTTAPSAPVMDMPPAAMPTAPVADMPAMPTAPAMEMPPAAEPSAPAPEPAPVEPSAPVAEPVAEPAPAEPAPVADQ